MTYNREFTSDFITELKPNEIFVFGSNIGGFHGGGAARVAHKRFGAEWGVACAKQHPELKFLVTKVACGIAGFRIEEIAPLFADAINMENVILPKEFVEVIENGWN